MIKAMKTAQQSCDFNEMLTVEQARAFLLERARPLHETETVGIEQALGRVLARGQRASFDVPGHDNSAMDGYAVCSRDVETQEALWLPVVQRIAAGDLGIPLERGQAARIFTGAPMPGGADAVVMQEHCKVEGNQVCIRGPVRPGQNVRPRGNDIAAGAEVLQFGSRLRPQEIGLAASLGLVQLPVFRRLKVAMFSSGSELVAPGEPLSPGKIYNSNRFTLGALLAGLGCAITDYGTVPDDLGATQRALCEAAREADVIITSGGVSVGEEDHLKNAVEAIGRLDLWRVAIKPGKPIVYGRVEGADFLGLPGNPVSVLVTFCLFARPFLLHRQNVADVVPRGFPVGAGFERKKASNRREYMRVRLHRDDEGQWQAVPFPNQGSDVLTSAVWAEGLAELPEGQTIVRGDRLTYLAFTELLN